MTMAAQGMRSAVSDAAPWNREERTKPRNIAGLAEFFAGCAIPISRRYIDAAIKSGGYVCEFGNLTTADHFLKWKSTTTFKCRFPRKQKNPAPRSRPPARRGNRARKSDE